VVMHHLKCPPDPALAGAYCLTRMLFASALAKLDKHDEAHACLDSLIDAGRQHAASDPTKMLVSLVSSARVYKAMLQAARSPAEAFGTIGEMDFESLKHDPLSKGFLEILLELSSQMVNVTSFEAIPA